jgi:hypothetical protein
MIWRLHKGLGIPAESLIRVGEEKAACGRRAVLSGVEFIDDTGAVWVCDFVRRGENVRGNEEIQHRSLVRTGFSRRPSFQRK